MSLTSRITEMVEATLAEAGHDDVQYEVVLNLIPTPQGPQPVIILAMAMPSMVLGEWVTGMTMIPNLMPSVDQISQTVLQVLNSLREQKAQVHEAHIQGPAPSANGHGPGKLILP